MLDWSASECKDYKDRAFATVACASHPDSPEQLSDTWEWRGPCCLVQSTSTIEKVSLHSDMERKHLARTHCPASKNYPCKA